MLVEEGLVLHVVLHDMVQQPFAEELGQLAQVDVLALLMQLAKLLDLLEQPPGDGGVMLAITSGGQYARNIAWKRRACVCGRGRPHRGS